jgi:ribosomal protein L37AE/L43A
MAKAKKEKTFKLKRCPSCNSDEIGVVVGLDKKGDWKCRKCDWAGKEIKEDELSEEEFMKYLDEKDEEVN